MTSRFHMKLACAVIAVMMLLISQARTPARQPNNQPNHFRCYIVSQQTPQPSSTVTLDDQFTEVPETVTVGEPVMFCAPTAKTVDETFPIEDEEEHYTLYTAPAAASPRTIFVTDQFGADVPWQVTTPKYIMVPTAKTIGQVTFDDRDNMNHYWCYEANGPRVNVRATLDDQFSGPDAVRITTPTLFCNPAEKVHGDDTFPIEDDELHLACYEIHGKQKTEQVTFGVENQFETDEYQITAWEIICAPAEKTLATVVARLNGFTGRAALRIGPAILPPKLIRLRLL